MTHLFKKLIGQEGIFEKKYYEMPDFMIFYQCNGEPSDEILSYVKQIQLKLEEDHGKKPRVLFNCEHKPKRNPINHFFSIIGNKVSTDQWWCYSANKVGEHTDCIWIKDNCTKKYKPEKLVEIILAGEDAEDAEDTVRSERVTEEYYLYK